MPTTGKAMQTANVTDGERYSQVMSKTRTQQTQQLTLPYTNHRSHRQADMIPYKLPWPWFQW